MNDIRWFCAHCLKSKDSFTIEKGELICMQCYKHEKKEQRRIAREWSNKWKSPKE